METGDSQGVMRKHKWEPQNRNELSEDSFREGILFTNCTILYL